METNNKEKEVQTTKEKIRQRRSQMLVHSFLYYHIDTSIVPDDKWQQWADELTQLQQSFPEECNIDFYDEEFKDWDGSTGCHLPKDAWVVDKAHEILRLCEK